MINFIGIGAQKSGTSWVYACLYEHPEICSPIKELHFFSRPRFEEGKGWYESHFQKCGDKVTGEFSTSYLYSEVAAERIHALYPAAKLIAIVRNPLTRTYSHYRNAIKSGEIAKEMSFADFVTAESSAREQGLYAAQLERYLKLFPREQLLVLVYEDSKKDPAAFIKKIYTFLGVDASFVPSMLHEEVNIARTPKHVGVERVMHHVAEFLRKSGLDKVVWYIKKSGLPELVRRSNTVAESKQTVDLQEHAEYFADDVARLSVLLDRDMRNEWGI